MELIASRDSTIAAIGSTKTRISDDFYNQLAWLVANTEGDFDEAVRLSEKSVELITRTARPRRPAQGDIGRWSARSIWAGISTRWPIATPPRETTPPPVKAQTEASRLMPYSQQIASKLDVFPQQAAADRAEGIAMKRLSVGGVDLHVLVRGSGLPLVLVHAFPLDHSMWAAQIERFASQAQVIAPDLRGFGSSGVTAGTVSMEQMADDLAGDSRSARRDRAGRAVLDCRWAAMWPFSSPANIPSGCGRWCCRNTRSAADTPEARQVRMNMIEQVLAAGPAPVADAMLPRLFTAGKFSRGCPGRWNSSASGFCSPRPRESPPRCGVWPSGPT